jgi:hypothetical protein
MDGIPPARDTDAEDVAWALQTAEALWKRNERGDAIVWLRRAAQAAGEANDDDRALALAREAAELTESFARASSASLSRPPVTEGSVSGVAIDSLLRSSQVDEAEAAPVTIPPSQVSPSSEIAPISIPDSQVASASELSPISVRLSDPPPETGAARVDHAAAKDSTPIRAAVPSAAESHAGMLDPWADSEDSGESEAAVRDASSAAPSPPRVEKQGPSSEDGVFTSAPPPKRSVSPAAIEPPRPAKVPERQAKPPPLRKTKSQALAAVLPPPVQGGSPATKIVPGPEPARTETKRDAPIEASTPPLDLSIVEAFADLPDDSRDALAKSATVRLCSKGDAVDSFALVYVTSGEFYVGASSVAHHATSLLAGAVVLGRGTLERAIELRLVAASPQAVAATWDAASVEAAMGSCPWVEEELRAAADRVQALAGASLGAFGAGLSPDLRANIIDKLKLKTLAEHETIVTEGLPVPGVLLVASGEVELVAGETVTGKVGAGQFVLPTEAMSAGPSPSSARAGVGGALLFAADRKTTQELFATQPLLLELFAGW